MGAQKAKGIKFNGAWKATSCYYISKKWNEKVGGHQEKWMVRSSSHGSYITTFNRRWWFVPSTIDMP
jgi:hypothetical protein